MACKKSDPYAVSGSIYGTYISSANGTYGSSGSSFGWAASIIKVAPINSTYIKITFPGFAGLGSAYDSVILHADKSFTIDQRPNGFHVFGNGNFGNKTISLDFRNDSSVIMHKCDNFPKVSNNY